jgi:hypothetical protein
MRLQERIRCCASEFAGAFRGVVVNIFQNGHLTDCFEDFVLYGFVNVLFLILGALRYSHLRLQGGADISNTIDFYCVL